SRRVRAETVARARRQAGRLLPAGAGAFANRGERRLKGSSRRDAGRGITLGGLGGTGSISRSFGSDRGTPVDRYYIEQFLRKHSGDVKGRVLEVKDDRYTTAIGGSSVEHSDILDILPSNPKATVVGDLAGGAPLGDAAFDCIIVTQTL